MEREVSAFIGIMGALGFFVCAQPVFAQVYSKEKIYHYLKSQQADQTGLVNSFTNTSDEMLINQASTYDQALAVIVFLLNKDNVAASRILDFYKSKWTGIGFPNFYNTNDGQAGIEGTIHLGPNAWIVLAALQYDSMTGKKRYYDFAHKIALWITQLPHDDAGGISMGSVADWGANWREVFSVENNIDAFVVFRNFLAISSSPDDRILFTQEVDGIKQFLKKKIFPQKPRIPVGPGNDFMASDVFAFSLLAFKPFELENEFGLSPLEMFQILDTNFLVETDDIIGYDFTDFLTKKTFARKPMISMEWSAMVALAYFKISDYDHQFYELSGNQKNCDDAAAHEGSGKKILGYLDAKAMLYGKTKLVYPYATKAWEQVFPFAPWWRTPQRGDAGRLAGSLSGTCWRVFAEERFNPFDLKAGLLKVAE